MPAASTNNIIKTPTFRSKVFWSITSPYESATRFPKPWPENQEKFLELILQKNSFGIPRCAQVTLCWLHAFSHFCTRKESEVLWDETPRARSCERIHPLVYSASLLLPLPPPPLFLSLVCVLLQIEVKVSGTEPGISPRPLHSGRYTWALCACLCVSRAHESISITYMRREELLRAACRLWSTIHIYIYDTCLNRESLSNSKYFFFLIRMPRCYLSSNFKRLKIKNGLSVHQTRDETTWPSFMKWKNSEI